MSKLSIRLTGNQTSNNGDANIPGIVAPATPYSPDLSSAVAPIIDGDAAKLLSLILSGGLDLSNLARLQSTSVPLDVLEGLARQWLFDCKHSSSLANGTIEGYAQSLERAFNWIADQGMAECGENELRAFFMALAEPEANRRANIRPDGTRAEGLSARTRGLCYANLRVFFNWCVRRGYLSSSPLARIEPPRQKKKPVTPFTLAQLNKLLAAARQTLHGARDYAILMLMLDCGLRAQELCDLRLCDVDFKERTVKIWHGKGDKERTVVFTPWTFTALWHYLSHYSRESHDALFTSQRGVGVGKHMTPRGLHLLFKRLGKAAGIEGVRCSPHTMRHAFATYYVQTGGSMEELQTLLGHTTMNMSREYVTLGNGHLKEKHLRHSPMNLVMGSGGAPRTPRGHIARVAQPLPLPAAEPNEDMMPLRFTPRQREHKGGRPRASLEDYPCTCNGCPDAPKKSCARGRVLIQRRRRERNPR